MKKITLLLLLSICSIVAVNAQSERNVWKFKTTAVSFKFTEEGDKKFREPENTSILVLMDYETDKVKIYSKNEQSFDIIEYYDWYVDKDGDNVQNLRVLDKDGVECTLTYLKLNSKGGALRQLYVRYSNLSYVYYMYNI